MLRLAALTKGPHRAVVINPAADVAAGSIASVNDQISTFLDQALNWTRPGIKTSRKVRNLLDAQVQRTQEPRTQ